MKRVKLASGTITLSTCPFIIQIETVSRTCSTSRPTLLASSMSSNRLFFARWRRERKMLCVGWYLVPGPTAAGIGQFAASWRDLSSMICRIWNMDIPSSSRSMIHFSRFGETLCGIVPTGANEEQELLCCSIRATRVSSFPSSFGRTLKRTFLGHPSARLGRLNKPPLSFGCAFWFSSFMASSKKVP